MNQKIICPKCKKFVGFLSSDGKHGPIVDFCLSNHHDAHCKHCPMVAMMAKYQPRCWPLGCGSPHTARDDGEQSGFGNYYTYGSTAEDQGEPRE